MSIHWTLRTANKANRYKCARCHTVIRPGEQYRLAEWNGRDEIARYHVTCPTEDRTQANER